MTKFNYLSNFHCLLANNWEFVMIARWRSIETKSIAEIENSNNGSVSLLTAAGKCEDN